MSLQAAHSRHQVRPGKFWCGQGQGQGNGQLSSREKTQSTRCLPERFKMGRGRTEAGAMCSRWASWAG